MNHHLLMPLLLCSSMFVSVHAMVVTKKSKLTSWQRSQSCEVYSDQTPIPQVTRPHSADPRLDALPNNDEFPPLSSSSRRQNSIKNGSYYTNPDESLLGCVDLCQLLTQPDVIHSEIFNSEEEYNNIKCLDPKDKKFQTTINRLNTFLPSKKPQIQLKAFAILCGLVDNELVAKELREEYSHSRRTVFNNIHRLLKLSYREHYNPDHFNEAARNLADDLVAQYEIKTNSSPKSKSSCPSKSPLINNVVSAVNTAPLTPLAKQMVAVFDEHSRSESFGFTPLDEQNVQPQAENKELVRVTAPEPIHPTPTAETSTQQVASGWFSWLWGNSLTPQTPDAGT